MKAEQLVEAFGIPEGSRVERRLPKATIAEHGASSPRDKRLIKDGVEQVTWVAALKPSTVSVAPYCDDEREYLEIAVLHGVLRGDSGSDRISSIMHRSIPYPVALVAETPNSVAISFAHKRWSRSQYEAIVLDGDVITRVFDQNALPFDEPFLETLDVAWQAEADLFDLYQRWIDAAVASLAAALTGRFELMRDPGMRSRRMEALGHYRRLESEAERTRAAASRERQISRRVTLNQQLRQLESQLNALYEQL